MATPEVIELAGISMGYVQAILVDFSAREVMEFLYITNSAVITCDVFRGGGGNSMVLGRQKKLMYQLNNSNTNEKVSLSLGNSLQEALRSCLVQLL